MKEHLDELAVCECGAQFNRRARGEEKRYCSERCRSRFNKRSRRAAGYVRPQTPICSVTDCGRLSQALGLCPAHYQRHRKGQPLDGPMRKRREGFDTCSVGGCDKQSWARGFCQMHYWRWRAQGDPGVAESMRPGGSRVTMRNGYVKIHDPSHPNAASDGYVLEHRIIVEQRLGRLLLSHESVHHINGDRTDNRPENLELWSKTQPAGQRVTDKVAWAVELLQLYAPELLAAQPVQLRLIT